MAESRDCLEQLQRSLKRSRTLTLLEETPQYLRVRRATQDGDCLLRVTSLDQALAVGIRIAPLSAAPHQHRLQEANRILEPMTFSLLPGYGLQAVPYEDADGHYIYAQTRINCTRETKSDFDLVANGLISAYSDLHRALAPLFAPRPRRNPQELDPRYHPVLPDGAAVDYLDFSDAVEPLARLIASRDLQPPLAIGVFGEWGAGKSFFMLKLRRAVDALVPPPATDRPAQSEIAHVHFNAWQYMQSDLWAALMLHIFKVVGGEVVAQALRGVSHDLNAQISLLQKQLESAKNNLNDYKRALQEQENRTLSLEEKRKALLKGIQDNTQSLNNLLRQWLRRPLEEHPDHDHILEALRLIRQDVQEIRLNGRAIAATIRHKPIRAWYLIGWLLLSLVLALFIGSQADTLLVGWSAQMGQTIIWGIPLYVLLSMIVGASGAMLTVLHPVLRQTAEFVQATRQALQKYDLLADDPAELREAVERHQELVAKIDTLRLKQQQCQQEIARLQRDEIRWFSEFVSSRFETDDYQKLLGVLAVAHKDLQALSHYLKDNRSKADHPNDTPLRRIVLYIDDLDRCPANKVMEVLQAVQLLLAQELFVVVVGVDVRWIARSLEAHYAGLLEEAPRPAPDRPTSQWMTPWEDVATPIDYLEKIFQVPVWINPPTTPQAQTMVRGLAAAFASPPPTFTGQDGAPPDGFSPNHNGPWPAAHAPTPSVQADQASLPLGPLELDPDLEVAFMHQIAPIAARTPRELGRFLNLYYLIKVCEMRRDAAEGNFVSDEAYSPHRAVMFLLALSLGTPNLALELFKRLYPDRRQAIPSFEHPEFQAIMKGLTEGSPAASEEVINPAAVKAEALRLRRCLDHDERGDLRTWFETVTAEQLRHYGTIVSRHSFRLGRLANDSSSPSPISSRTPPQWQDHPSR